MFSKKYFSPYRANLGVCLFDDLLAEAGSFPFPSSWHNLPMPAIIVTWTLPSSPFILSPCSFPSPFKWVKVPLAIYSEGEGDRKCSMDLFQRTDHPPRETFPRTHAHVRRKCGLLEVIWLAEHSDSHSDFEIIGKWRERMFDNWDNWDVHRQNVFLESTWWRMLSEYLDGILFGLVNRRSMIEIINIEE